jgi:hypothetical protein
MKVTGGCHCGKIAYEAEIDPDTVRICHCTDCQNLTGTAFRTVVPTLPGSFVLTRGEAKGYVKTADSGTRRIQAFCPDCGTPLYAASADGPPNPSLRVGSINERAQLKPKRQIWCQSALPWAMDVSGLPRFERQP